MSNDPRLALVLLTALLMQPPLQAQTHRLDDTGTHTVPANAQMQWQPFQRGQTAGMQAQVRVNVRMDTSAWVGQQARVYLALASDEANPVTVSWTTNGRLLDGALRSGERTLIYTGPIPGPTLQDQLVLQLTSGPDWASAQRRLQFHFELDTE